MAGFSLVRIDNCRQLVWQRRPRVERIRPLPSGAGRQGARNHACRAQLRAAPREGRGEAEKGPNEKGGGEGESGGETRGQDAGHAARAG